MSVITISRGTFSGSKEFAEQFAQKLNYLPVSREELTKKAREFGIPVDKLHGAIAKPSRAFQPLGHLRDIYLAFMRSELCDLMLKENIVYHGHTGHLLFKGIPNIFRIRIMADMEYRIRAIGDKLKLSREKAKEYIEKVDAERDRWVRFLYGINWNDPIHYDIIVNLAEVSVGNFTSSLCTVAELPEFSFTPAAIKAIENLRLASRARLKLGMDKRTEDAEVKIRANNGLVNVTYSPQQADVAPHVSEVLAGLEGCREVNCTIASTNILWIQEEYDAESESFRNVLEVAKKWDAAVELMQWHPSAGGVQPAGEHDPAAEDTGTEGSEAAGQDAERALDPGVSKVREVLLKEGHAGGCVTVAGGIENLCSSIHHPVNYSLIVLDNLFLSKSHSAQKRLIAEARSTLADSFNLPVIESGELKQQVKFGIKEKFKLVMRAAVAVALFLAVFLNQERVLTFMTGEEYKAWRILAILLVLVFVPSFAYTYATTMKTILKRFRID